MAVNLTDAQIRNLFPTYFEPSYTGNITVAKIKQILNTYSDKIGGQSYIANELKVNPSIVGRILKIAKAKKIIKQVPPGEFTATSQKVWTEENPRKIYKVARLITERDRTQNPDIPKNAKWKMQVAGGQFRDADSSTQMIYGASKSDLNKRLKKIESKVYVKPVSGKYDPDSPLYEPPPPPKKFLLKTNIERAKENINKVTYEEVQGIKNYPETYKPTGRTVIKYKPMIGENKVTIPGEGADTLEEAQKFVDDYFKKNPKQIRVRDPAKDYASKDVRKKALKETDPTGAIGTKKFNYHHIRQIAGGVPLTTDDVMIINQRINSALGTKYNKPLNAISAAIQKNNRLALEAMNAKNEGAALDYMKRSDDLNASAEKIVNSAIDKLPKKYKGYVGFNQFTLPRDEYGLPIQREPMIIKKVGGMPVSTNAIDLTDLNLKQEKEFNKIVRAQAEKGKIGPIKNIQTKLTHLNFFDDVRADALEGGQICRLVRATGATGGTLTCVDAVEEAIQKEPEKLAQKASRLEKFKNSATGFLNFAKKGGKFGAIAAVGAAGAGLVKTFMNDDPTTYLSNEDQQKNMLISMVTDPMVDQPDPSPEILDWQLPALGATAAAGTAVTAPSTIEASRSARFGKKPSGYTKTALKTLGRGLATTGTPLGLAAFEPLHIAGQVQAGDSLGEIATNPWNYAGLAFADDLSKFATKGLGPNIAKAMRLGISPAALKVGSRFLGLPGLALSLGISGYETYDDWKNKRGWFSEE